MKTKKQIKKRISYFKNYKRINKEKHLEERFIQCSKAIKLLEWVIKDK